MSGDKSEKIQLTLPEGQAGMMTQGGVTACFNKAGELQVTHNGQTITVYDPKTGLLVPPAVPNDKPIDGAPAVLWHKTNGRLTKKDIGQTIGDEKDNPIGIYTGVWRPTGMVNQEFRTYAALTDLRDGDGERLHLSFNQYVGILNKHPDGEVIPDRPPSAPDVYYQMEMWNRMTQLQPGKRTGWMIPPFEILSGRQYPDLAVTHKNNMVNLWAKGDFAKADNNGYNSGFEVGNFYVSATERRIDEFAVYGVSLFDGTHICYKKDIEGYLLRPFRVERPQL